MYPDLWPWASSYREIYLFHRETVRLNWKSWDFVTCRSNETTILDKTNGTSGSQPPPPPILTAKMARFCPFALSSVLWGGGKEVNCFVFAPSYLHHYFGGKGSNCCFLFFPKLKVGALPGIFQWRVIINLVPRVSPPPAPGNGKKRDPENETRPSPVLSVFLIRSSGIQLTNQRAL